MTLFTLGLNHRTAPLPVREQLAFHAEELGRALEGLVSNAQAHEAVILSTCNRTELWGGERIGTGHHRPPGTGKARNHAG